MADSAFDARLRLIAARLARAIIDETIRRTGPDSTVDAVGKIGTETCKQVEIYTAEVIARRVRAAHNEATIADFRKEIEHYVV